MTALMKYLVSIILVFTATLGAYAGNVIPIPRDMPTIEALIDLHKMVRKEEAAASARLLSSEAEQNLITKGADKARQVREYLETRSANAYSYVIFASSLSSASLSLYKLIDDYSEFTRRTAASVADNPGVAWYFANAQVSINREIKHIKRLLIKMTSQGFNLIKATMDERLNMVFTIQSGIEAIRGIIHNAALYCSLVSGGYWQPDYLKEIMNSDILRDIAYGIISKWKRQ